MNVKVETAIYREGFCCAYRFFKETIGVKEVALASMLNVEPRTIRMWRRKYREGQLACKRNANCPHRED